MAFLGYTDKGLGISMDLTFRPLPGDASFDSTDVCLGHAHDGLSAWVPRMAGIFKRFSGFRGRSGAMLPCFLVW